MIRKTVLGETAVLRRGSFVSIVCRVPSLFSTRPGRHVLQSAEIDRYDEKESSSVHRSSVITISASGPAPVRSHYSHVQKVRVGPVPRTQPKAKNE